MPTLFMEKLNPPNTNRSSTGNTDSGSDQPQPPEVPSSPTPTEGDRGSPPPPSRPSSLLPSSCCPITLKFMDVCYRVKLDTVVDSYSGCTCTLKRILCCGSAAPPQSSQPSIDHHHQQEKTILHGVSGVASPGEILAVLGPSGSGKSTLLNALAGRLHGHGLTGSILANDKKVSKSVLRRTGFVAQDDCLYPHLTVRETLVFCAMLRMPGGGVAGAGTTKEEKVEVVEAVIEELGLSKCADTIVGNSFIRGVSGGERKRVSIAHEMLLNPSLLILDEPTSGLDSTAAYGLVSKLVSMAKKNGKTIVLSVHQPSSRVYQALDRVMLLSEGRPLYFGKGSEAMRYFESVGFAPSFPMNPADFMLDLANGIFHLDGSPSEKDKKSMNVRQSLVSSYNNLLSPTVKSLCHNTTTTTAPSTFSTIDSSIVEVGRRRRSGLHNHWHRLSTSISTWLNELMILFQRSLKERKHESFNSLRVLQVVAAALLAGIMWWHSDPLHVQDRLGLLFFVSIFWGVFPSMNAAFAFPQDRAIFLKERASGMYTLSSYFMARIVGDLPMELILPTIFMALVYWMTGLRPGLCSFVLSVVVVLGYVLVAQGLGLAVGAMLMDAKRASTVVTITMLAFVLTGGFYVHKMPSCFGWIKYVSVTYYCYRLLIGVQYGDGKGVSRLLGCDRRWGAGSAMCRFVEEDVEGQISVGASVGVLLVMFVGYRVIAYIALKRIKL